MVRLALMVVMCAAVPANAAESCFYVYGGPVQDELIEHVMMTEDSMREKAYSGAGYSVDRAGNVNPIFMNVKRVGRNSWRREVYGTLGQLRDYLDSAAAGDFYTMLYGQKVDVFIGTSRLRAKRDTEEPITILAGQVKGRDHTFNLRRPTIVQYTGKIREVACDFEFPQQ